MSSSGGKAGGIHAGERRFALALTVPGLLVLLLTTTFPLLYLIWSSFQTINLAMPFMDGFKFLEKMRESRYHKGLPVIVITIKRLTPEEEDQLADMASAIVIKDQGFVPRVRAHLATLFPPRPRESEAKPTAD